MDLLKELYHGRLAPFGEANQWWNEEYVTLSREITEAEAEINAVSPEVEKLFEHYQLLQNKMDDIIMYHEFSTGFRFGAQLMEEMLKPLASMEE